MHTATQSPTEAARDKVHAICMYCHAARLNKTTWRVLPEGTMPSRQVSHGVCPSCYDQAIKQLIFEMKSQTA